MRVLAFAILLAAAAVGSAQSPRREGSYTPKGGKAAAWRIDDNHGLVWNESRYTPVGVRVDGTAAAVDAANAAGIKDLLIDVAVGADWSAAVQAAERNGQRYLLRLDSLAPGASGVEIDPAAYRVAGLTGPKHVDLPIPGATDALVIVALQRDASVVSKEIVPIKDGRLVYDTHINAGLDNVVLIYPRTENLELPDFWQKLDAHRDALLVRLKSTPFGDGFRGLVDPLGKTASLPGREVHGVPTSPEFQIELAGVLERKHTTVENVMDAWSMGASSLSTGVTANGKTVTKTTYLDLAKLVPLWSGARGVSQLWDPGANKFYNCTKDKSRIWEDIKEALALAAARRVARLCDGIRRVVDVPIVQEWAGWSGLTEESEPAFDGIAARISGESPSELVDSAARAISTVARWKTRGWLVATEVTVPPKDLPPSIEDLANLGLRAAFVTAPTAVVAPLATARVASTPPDLPIDALFFPENAANPAAVQRLPGGRWWLPTPEDGNRLDFGDSFYGYRIATPKGQDRVVLWARTPGRYLLRMQHPELATFTPMDGADPAPKKAKGGVLVTLGQVPVAIDGLTELPVPDLALKETLETFMRLSATAESGRHVGTDEGFAFTQAAQAFEINPGGNFTEMRIQLRKFAVQLSPLSWVEGESAQNSTFSEIAPFPGASGDRALVLRATIPAEDGYIANYTIPVTNRDSVELWVAARIPEAHRRELEAVVGGNTLVASEHSVSSYGAGFAWYHLGTTRLSGGIARVTFRMRSGVGTDAAIDAVVFAPPTWRPDGVAYPYGLIAGPAVTPGKP